MNLQKIRTCQDNVLVRMAHHEKREEVSRGGIVIPDTARRPDIAEGVLATVISCGPGYHPGLRCDHCGKSMDRCRECGSQSTAHRKVFIEAPCKVGDTVVLSDRNAGDVVHDDHDVEHRIVKFDQVLAVFE